MPFIFSPTTKWICIFTFSDNFCGKWSLGKKYFRSRKLSKKGDCPNSCLTKSTPLFTKCSWIVPLWNLQWCCSRPDMRSSLPRAVAPSTVRHRKGTMIKAASYASLAPLKKSYSISCLSWRRMSLRRSASIWIYRLHSNKCKTCRPS